MSGTAARGSKIAELRKFFDSGASNSDPPCVGKHRKTESECSSSDNVKTSETESAVRLSTSSLWNGVDTGSSSKTDQRYASTTSELSSLIAATKAELSKNESEASLPEKSTLENYFAYAFDSSCDKSNGLYIDDDSRYDCDGDEMFFEDLEDGATSDTSSDDEMRCHSSPPSSHHLQPFSLHTIIEESCEESERESQNATPTNQGPASKLEKYFSWDIVNQTNCESKKRNSLDESTLYSDSLSEASSSLNGEDNDVEPSPLSSSRLEKYFMSGLVGNENYHYPEDAEFLDDTSISDFDEDDRYHKISRSALLTSLDLKSVSNSCETFNLNFNSNSQFCAIDEESEGCVSTDAKGDAKLEDVGELSSMAEKYVIGEESLLDCQKNDREVENTSSNTHEVFLNGLGEQNISVSVKESLSLGTDVHPESLEFENNCDSVSNAPDPLENSSKLPDDPKSILDKIMSQISETPEETNYISAWRLLENEIEQLMSHVTLNSGTENNSRTSSTIGSSNSDYGSDTVDSGECLTTDEDDNYSELKNKSEVGQNTRPFDEAVVYQKFVESLKNKDFADCLKLSDSDNNEAHLYIKDYIVSFVKNMNHNRKIMIVEECEKSCMDEQFQNPECFGEKQVLSDVSSMCQEVAIIDEGISVDSTENLCVDCDPEPVQHVSDVGDKEQVMDSAVDVSNTADQIVLSASSSDIESDGQNVDDTCILPPSEIKEDLTVDEGSLETSDESKAEESPTKDSLLGIMNESHSSLDDTTSQFSVYVDIQIGDNNTSVKERTSESLTGDDLPESITKRSSFHLWVSPDPKENSLEGNTSKPLGIPEAVDDPDFVPSKAHFRDTGYYSFKSSEDSMLYGAGSENDLVDSHSKGEFLLCTRRSSVKSTSSAAALSHSTTNIPDGFDPNVKFNTLQPKSKTLKVSMNPLSTSTGSPSFTSFFSPSAVLKKLKPNKNSSSEVSYPSKYLKKYARSYSVDNESMYGATSMPHLGVGSDSCSMNGGIECDRVSSLTLDDEIGSKYSHSILSLGAHSASTTSVYSAAGGRHFGYVSITGDVLFGLNYNQKSQTMEVFVKQCRNLAAADLRKNKSDPYVKVYLLPDKTKSGKRKTKTKRGTLNPVFNELLRFPVLKHELEARTLWLSVWNSDLFGRNDFLGEVSLNLGYRLLDSPTLRWYPLQERTESLSCPLTYKGELFLALKYVPKDLSLEPRFRPAPVISLKGALHVLIKEARNIAPGKGTGAFDSFCKCYLLPDKSKSSKQKTPVLKKSRHPKWYYTIVYEDLSVEELKDRSLELTLWDHDTLTSNEFVGAVRLNCGTGLYHGVPVEWMDATRDEASLWCAMLERPNMWVDGSLPLRPTMQSLRS